MMCDFYNLPRCLGCDDDSTGHEHWRALVPFEVQHLDQVTMFYKIKAIKRKKYLTYGTFCLDPS
jgi:hypothetical protein